MVSDWTLAQDEPPGGELWTPLPRPGFAAVVWWSLRYSRRRPYVALRRAVGYTLLALGAAVVALGIARLLA